jgi:hypothetical protein
VAGGIDASEGEARVHGRPSTSSGPGGDAEQEIAAASRCGCHHADADADANKRFFWRVLSELERAPGLFIIRCASTVGMAMTVVRLFMAGADARQSC